MLPIGTDENGNITPFVGIFDGKEYSIKGLKQGCNASYDIKINGSSFKLSP